MESNILHYLILSLVVLQWIAFLFYAYAAILVSRKIHKQDIADGIKSALVMLRLGIALSHLLSGIGFLFLARVFEKASPLLVGDKRFVLGLDFKISSCLIFILTALLSIATSQGHEFKLLQWVYRKLYRFFEGGES